MPAGFPPRHRAATTCAQAGVPGMPGIPGVPGGPGHTYASQGSVAPPPWGSGSGSGSITYPPPHSAYPISGSGFPQACPPSSFLPPSSFPPSHLFSTLPDPVYEAEEQESQSVTSQSESRYEDISDVEEEKREDSFASVPGLEDFRLSGARVAVNRSKSSRAPDNTTYQLWYNARGLNTEDGWKSIRASKVVATYTNHPEATIFKAQESPSVFPLDPGAIRRDEHLASQQTRLGAAGHALCLAMSSINKTVDLLTSDESAADIVSRAQEMLANEAGKALGHTLRVLAAECNQLCQDRRRLCLDTLQDSRDRQEMEKSTPGTDALFGQGVSVEKVMGEIDQRRKLKSPFKKITPRHQHQGPQKRRAEPSDFRHQTKYPRPSSQESTHKQSDTHFHKGHNSQPFRGGRGRGRGQSSSHSRGRHAPFQKKSA